MMNVGLPVAVALSVLATLGASSPAAAQQPHFTLPPAEIERRLAEAPFELAALADNRWEGDRTQRAALRFRDGVVLGVKWARAAPGGFAINNEPRYELAAYRLQSLFLDPADHVVPPTAVRSIPLSVYRQLDPEVAPTFEGTGAVLVAVQYWLHAVDMLEMPDTARLSDPRYRRRLADVNLLTYLIRHADSNAGNVLIASEGEPRMFAVDNGVAFSSPESPRGTLWKDLLVGGLPADRVERLRAIEPDALRDRLAVVAQFRVDADGRLHAEPPGPKITARLGVERAGDVIQLGLTEREIDGVMVRLRELLRRLDAGEIRTY